MRLFYGIFHDTIADVTVSIIYAHVMSKVHTLHVELGVHHVNYSCVLVILWAWLLSSSCVFLTLFYSSYCSLIIPVTKLQLEYSVVLRIILKMIESIVLF
jgi:hypothetical protein